MDGSARYSFFLPEKVLSRVFRGKFLAGLKRLYRRQLDFAASGPPLLSGIRQQFAQLLRRSAPPRLGGLCQAGLRWPHAGDALSRALHPSGGDLQSSLVGLRARARHLSLEGLRPRRQAGEDDTRGHRVLALLRRFFLHVLAKGFVRIRHFGFLANRFRASHRSARRGSCWPPVVRRSRKLKQTTPRSETSSLWHCPRCGASMIVIQRFTAAELSACMYFDSS